MSKFLKFSYYLGCKHAMDAVGMPSPAYDEDEEDPKEQLPAEQLSGDALGPAGLGVADAESFVNFVEKDPTEDVLDGKLDIPNLDEKAVHWGGKASLESGDTGTRNEQMGLPRFNGA